VHVVVTDNIDEDEPRFHSVLAKKVEMSETISQLVEALGPFCTGLCTEIGFRLFQCCFDLFE
jgi:hypothetical protein